MLDAGIDKERYFRFAHVTLCLAASTCLLATHNCGKRRHERVDLILMMKTYNPDLRDPPSSSVTASGAYDQLLRY